MTVSVVEDDGCSRAKRLGVMVKPLLELPLPVDNLVCRLLLLVMLEPVGLDGPGSGDVRAE
jgi:hypothetical protein